MSRLINYLNDDPAGVTYDQHENISTIYDDEIEHRYDLHYDDGNSNKVYIILTVRRYNQDVNEVSYHTIGCYGRNGAKLQSKDYGPYNHPSDARDKARELVNQKHNKGYGIVNDETLAKKPSAKRKADSIFAYINGIRNHIPLQEKMTNINYILNSEDFVLEESHKFNTMGIAVLTAPMWIFYDMLSNRIGTVPIEQHLRDTAHMNHLSYFYGYLRLDGTFAIMDPIKFSSIGEVWDKEWKQRRAMLTTFYTDLYPNVADPYDRKNPVHLNEYYYENKQQHYPQKEGWFRRINTPFQESLLSEDK